MALWQAWNETFCFSQPWCLDMNEASNLRTRERKGYPIKLFCLLSNLKLLLLIWTWQSSRTLYGVEFLVLFSSCSFCLALELSLKSHQMTIVFNKNENWEKNEVVLMKTVVIWWLLRMTSGVKSIKTVGYNGVRMVFVLDFWHFRVWNISWVWNSENIIYLKLGSDKLSSN